MFVSKTILRLSVRISEACHQAKMKIVMMLITLAAANPATAHAGNLSDILTSLANGAGVTEKAMIVIARVLGVGFVIGGIIAGKNKKSNPQIQTWHIVSSIVFGILLISLGEMIRRGQNEAGLSEVSIG